MSGVKCCFVLLSTITCILNKITSLCYPLNIYWKECIKNVKHECEVWYVFTFFFAVTMNERIIMLQGALQERMKNLHTLDWGSRELSAASCMEHKLEFV